MAVLNKLVSGILHEETFDNHNLLWELSPNDYNRLSFNNNGVGLAHGDVRISMSMPTPSGTYVFQAEVTHLPVTLSDVGGILISSITDNYIECQTYFNSGAGDQQYYRYIKVCADKGVYSFHASKDSKLWSVLGNAELPEANRIGFFLDGIVTPLSKDFIAHNVAIYKSNVITLNNISIGSTVKILNPSGKDILKDNINGIYRYGKKIYLDLKSSMFPLKHYTIQVFDELGIKMVEEKDIELCGGDIFECSENVEFAIDGKVINMNTVYDLGRLTATNTTYKLTIKNLDVLNIANKKLKVIAYSDYYRGETCASLAIATDNKTPLSYSKELSIPVIPPGSTIDLVIKIDKDINNLGPFLADKYKFKIVLE